MHTEQPARPILVVDDNAATRYATSRVLRAAGYEAVTAATGYEAGQSGKDLHGYEGSEIRRYEQTRKHHAE